MISGSELFRRGYRLVKGERYCLRMPDGFRLQRDQGISFSSGESETAETLAKRLAEYRPVPTAAQMFRAARRRHRREQRRQHA